MLAGAFWSQIYSFALRDKNLSSNIIKSVMAWLCLFKSLSCVQAHFGQGNSVMIIRSFRPWLTPYHLIDKNLPFDCFNLQEKRFQVVTLRKKVFFVDDGVCPSRVLLGPHHIFFIHLFIYLFIFSITFGGHFTIISIIISTTTYVNSREGDV